MSDPDEIVQYIIFRKDLKLSPGKIAAQAGHAVQLALETIWRKQEYEWAHQWKTGSYTKIVLQVKDKTELHSLADSLDADNRQYSWVIDHGRTEIEPGTVTCMALQPMPRSIAAKYVGSLGLLR